MKKPVVVLTHDIYPEVIRQDLRPKAEVIRPRSDAELKRALRDADALITVLSVPVTPELLSQAPRLKVVGNYAVGVNNIDLEACQKRGVRVVNTPGVLTRATAELAATLLLSVARRVPEGEELCRSGKFKGWEPNMLLGLELKGRHAVIVGRGRIGRETARIFRGLGLTVEFITREEGAASIRQALRRAQVLSLNTPLTPLTRHWLSRDRIALLPSDAIVINTARGPVADEKALISALASRKIFGAGFDVYEQEPEIPLALRRLPNVVLLPHLGSGTIEAREAMARLVVRGVLEVLQGKNPRNRVV